MITEAFVVRGLRLDMVMRQLFCVLALSCVVFAPIVVGLNRTYAQTIDTLAEFVILIDDTTRTVLLEKNSDQQMQPASMSKLMTAYVAFDSLHSGNLSLDDTFRVSEKAWKKGGSRMFVEIGSRVRIEDLLRGMIVQSGNDASIVLAEGIGGSEELFASEMNRYAAKLGLNGTNFKNATGWPDPEHLTTARDLSILAHRLIHDFPAYVGYYAEKTFTYNGIKQGNRNPLLYKDLGADGLKTGHTEVSGYGLVGTAKRKNRRLILVINGLDNARQRSHEAERILDWGFREFNNYTLFRRSDIVKDIPVWLGESQTVPAVLKEDLVVTINRRSRAKLRAILVFDSPIEAPVKNGDQVATLRIEMPDGSFSESPVIASREVKRLGVFGRLGAIITYLIFGSTIG